MPQVHRLLRAGRERDGHRRGEAIGRRGGARGGAVLQGRGHERDRRARGGAVCGLRRGQVRRLMKKRGQG